MLRSPSHHASRAWRILPPLSRHAPWRRAAPAALLRAALEFACRKDHCFVRDLERAPDVGHRVCGAGEPHVPRVKEDAAVERRLVERVAYLIESLRIDIDEAHERHGWKRLGEHVRRD